MQASIVEDTITKATKGYTLELDCLSDYGSYKLRLSETLLKGERHRLGLVRNQERIMAFLGLKVNPFIKFEEEEERVMRGSKT
jgi:hypothetical protein